MLRRLTAVFSGPFVSDTSPKPIDREGLGESRTGTRQGRTLIAGGTTKAVSERSAGESASKARQLNLRVLYEIFLCMFLIGHFGELKSSRMEGTFVHSPKPWSPYTDFLLNHSNLVRFLVPKTTFYMFYQS